MTRLSCIALLFGLTVFSQSKDNIEYRDLTTIEGTDFVVASAVRFSKADAPDNRILLFINTKTGQTRKVEFEGEGYPGKVKQVKIDAFGINKIIVAGQTIGKFSKAWNAPSRLMVFSADGNEKTTLTEASFFVKTWEVNDNTATIVVSGEYDSNGNGKSDKTDRNEIHVYDLNTLKLLHRF